MGGRMLEQTYAFAVGRTHCRRVRRTPFPSPSAEWIVVQEITFITPRVLSIFFRTASSSGHTDQLPFLSAVLQNNAA